MAEVLPVVAIDGPAGVGKSTVAGLLASKLRIPSLDTGAMFRALAFKLGSGALGMTPDELREEAGACHFSVERIAGQTRLFCNGAPIGAEIRTEEVGALASSLATRPEIRQALLEEQRALARKSPLVAEGRDMGTVVFPTARFKFFLDATPETRALRRWHDLAALGAKVDIEKLEAEIRKRDEQDRNRPIAPLKPAPDAILVDTAKMDANQTLDFLLNHINSRGGLPIFGDRPPGQS